MSATPAAQAQSAVDGAVEGRAETFQGKPLAGATVTLRSLDGHAEWSLRTGADGSFLYPHVPPGSYVVSAGGVSGLVPAVSPAFVVALGETTQVDVAEQLSAASVTVEVSATPPETLPDGTAAAIGRDALTQLPQPAPRWQDFALTASGINPDQDGDGLVSAHGLPSDQNTVLVDGQETTQSFGSVPAGTGSAAALNPDEDADSAEQSSQQGLGQGRGRRAGASFVFSEAAVREFRISSLGYSAQTSHAAGVVVETITREGTGTMHGGGSYLVRSDLLAARDPLAIATSYADGVVSTGNVKPHDLRQDAALWAGGPLLPRRGHGGQAPLTFFSAFDLERRDFPAVSTPADPAFYQLTSIQTALLATRGVTTAQTNAALDFISSLSGLTPRRSGQAIAFARIDWRPGAAQSSAAAAPRPFRRPGLSLGLTYNHAQWSSPAGLRQAPTVAYGRGSLGNAAGSVDSALLQVTEVFGPRLVNQLRVGFLRDLQFETAQDNLPQEPRIGPGGRAPEVNIAPNGFVFGTPPHLSEAAYPKEQRLSLDEVLTLVLGRHLLAVGGTAALVQDHIATQPNAAGAFSYDSNPVRGFAGGLVDFITDYTFNVNHVPNGGCPSIAAVTHGFCFRSYTQSFGESSAAFRTADESAFAEDTWRLRHGLTLHAGLRYEYTLLPLPQQPNAALDTLFGASGASSVFPEDRNNVAPRVAFAYAPERSRWSVRGGFGLYYGRLAGATIVAALSETAQPGSVSRLRITPGNETACPQAPANGFGYPCSFSAPPAGAAIAASTSAMVFDRRFRLPAVAQGSFTLRRRLGRAGEVSAGYLFDLDRQLPSSTDLNIAPSNGLHLYQLQGGTGTPGVRDGERFELPFYTARLSPSFGPVTDIRSSANATYHALVTAAELHPLRMLDVRANYTWAKAIDFNPSLSATPRTDNQFDPFSDGYDKGLSALNYPHTLHAVAVWEPHLTGKEGLRTRFGSGWSAAPALVVHSGRPYTYELSGGSALAGGHESLNGSGGALYLPTVGRNTLRLPPVVQVDLRVSRQTRLGGPDSPLRLRLAAEAFNLLNHRNLSAVSERAYLVGTTAGGVTPLIFQSAANVAAEGLNVQPFGTPTSASTSLTRERQVQFGVRVEF